MAKVVWTDQAIADVFDIVTWISAERPGVAVRIAEKLFRAGYRLDQFPERGRTTSLGRRELIVMVPT